MINNVEKTMQDMRHLQWSTIRHSSGTSGSFMKATESVRGEKLYYKLSNFDAFRGVIGHECVNEIIVDRLLTVLGVPHLRYQLVNARIEVEGQEFTTWICRSRDFKRPGESKIAFDAFYQMEREVNESPLEFCARMGWEDYVYQMLAVDYLILNRDRHGANLEVLRDREQKTLRLAPLFDHGVSLLFSAHTEREAYKFDVMEDRPVQSFVGSRSAVENLKLIPKGKPIFPGSLRETDRSGLFEDLEGILPEVFYDRIWEMIKRRWAHYESICDP